MKLHGLIKSFILIFTMLGFISTSFALINGQGEYTVLETDSPADINKELLHEAFKDSLSHLISDLGLNKEAFWSQFQIRFEDKLKSEYKGQTRSAAEKQFFIDLKLNNVISSYVVKERSLSASNPKKRFIKIEANTNNDLMKKIYFQFVKVESKQSFKKVYFTSNFNLKELNWTELGFNSKDDLASLVNKNWVKNLSEKFQDIGIEVGLTDSSTQERIENFTASNSPSSNSEFIQTLWITLNIDIRKKNEYKAAKQKELEFDGSVIVYDLNYRKIVYQFTIPKESNLYDFSTDRALSSVATSIYNLPLGPFSEIRKTTETLSVSSNQANLNISNYSSLKDIYLLQDILNNSGARFSIQTQISQVMPSEVSLIIFFEGEKSQLEIYLKSLEGQALKNGKRILIPNKENPYQLIIKDDQNDSGAKVLKP